MSVALRLFLEEAFDVGRPDEGAGTHRRRCSQVSPPEGNRSVLSHGTIVADGASHGRPARAGELDGRSRLRYRGSAVGVGVVCAYSPWEERREVRVSRFARGFVAGILVAVSLSAGLHAEDDVAVSQLHAMLEYVPSAAASIESGWATVRFVDFEALFESEGLSLFRELGSVDLLMESVPLGRILSRIIAGPEALAYAIHRAGRMTELVGFEWLLDVDRSLEFGDPPDLGLLLAGEFDVEAIAAALESRGFSVADVEGVPVWHRFDDFAVSIAARDPADPFGGNLGAAARVALLPDTLANARSWQLIEDIVSAALATEPSLAEDPAYRALTEAITGPDGMLIQALFFPGAALRSAGGSTQTDREPTDELDPLPAFSVAVLADRQEGGDQVHLIALACVDEATASTAADVLARRVERFYLPSRPEDVLADRFGATVCRREVRQTQDGVAIAVVEARYPVPEGPTDPQTGQYNVRGLLFRSWVQAILRREFTPLW